MIDEKKLIEELNRKKYILTFEDSNPIDEGFNCGIDKAIQLVESQPKVGEWIPCNERLPEDNQAVLTCRNKHISIFIWKSERRIWLEPKGNWWWSYCTVEKWQPLPEPFKGD